MSNDARDDNASTALATWLERADPCLTSGDREGAYAALVDAWRASPAAELAELVELAADRLGNAKLPRATSLKATHAAWLERAGRRDVLDLAALVKVVDGLVKDAKAELVVASLDQLTFATGDPLLSSRAAQWLDAGVSSRAWMKVQLRLLKLLEASKDPRAIARLQATIARVAATTIRDGSEACRADLLERAPKCLEKLKKTFPQGVPPLPTNVEAAVASLRLKIDQYSGPREPRSRSTAAELLAQVYANPTEVGLRAVYSDALTQEGDPRGELIALSLLRERSHDAELRLRNLMEKHQKAMLGPLAEVILPGSAVFEDGFLSRCEVRAKNRVVAAATFESPAWATVKEIRFSQYCALGRHMLSLERARSLPESGLLGLQKFSLPRLSDLEIVPGGEHAGSLRVSEILSAGLRAFAETKNLPALRRLRIAFGPAEAGYDAVSGTPTNEARVREASDYRFVTEAPWSKGLELLAVAADLSGPSRPIVLSSWVAFVKNDALPSLQTLVLNDAVALTKAGKTVEARHVGVARPDSVGWRPTLLSSSPACSPKQSSHDGCSVTTTPRAARARLQALGADQRRIGAVMRQTGRVMNTPFRGCPLASNR